MSSLVPAVGRATVWSRLLSFVLSLTVLLLAVAPVAATSISTDLWIYQQGDTVNVTGDGFDPSENVEIVTTDPYAVEVDRGTVLSDAVGNIAYSFVLNSDVPGIYDVVATGLSSRLSASTQFDPQSVTITGRNPNDAARPWFRTVGSGFDVIIAGSTACTGANPTGCNIVNGVAVTLVGLPAPNNTKNATLGVGTWTVTFQFRTAAVGTQLAIPASGPIDVSAVGSFTLNNASTTTASDSSAGHFGVDNTLPLSAITSPMPAPPYGGSGHLTVSGTASDTFSGLAADAVTVTLRSGTPSGPVLLPTVDNTKTNSASGGAWSVTFNSPPTAPGTYCVASEALDRAGNHQSPVASQCWTIAAADTSAPDTSITANPSNPSASSSASFSFTGSDNITPAASLTFECKLDAGAFAACTSPKAYAALTDGSHTFSVRAIDGASNVDPSPASFTWVVDTSAPDTSITANPSNPSASSSASFSFTGSDNITPAASLTFECKLDAGAFAACTSPKAYAALTDGSHTFSVRAIDGASNVDPSPASFTWVVDTAAPVITASATKDDASVYLEDTWTNQTVTVSFSCSDSGGSGIAVDTTGLDGGVVSGDTATGSFTSAGSHCVDNAGNPAASNTFSPIKVDKTLPVIAGSRLPVANANGWNNTDVVVSFTCTDPNGIDPSGIDIITVAGGTLSSEGAGQSKTNTGSCVDLAGNAAVSATVSGINIDKTLPVIAGSRLPVANAN
ncbi:MAG: hypothetical protein ABJC39_10905, partial [Chloroflexota bacterium]